MGRRAIQTLSLVLLFAVLAAGGQATFCQLLSAVGLEAHHHACDGAGPAVGGPCLDSHSHDSGDSPVPCPETCRIQVDEAAPPLALKLPVLHAVIDSPDLALPAVPPPADAISPRRLDDPPDRSPSRHTPAFTGRFLI